MAGITITGGCAKGRTFHKIPARVRPTPAKLRQALFEILGDIDGLDFIDLFSGAGAVGIEALSRGAASVTFVDITPASLRAIDANIAAVGLSSLSWKTVCDDAVKYLGWFLPARGSIIFASPPYIDDFLPKILSAYEDFASAKNDMVLPVLQFPKRALNRKFEVEPSKVSKMGDDLLIFW